VWFEVYIADGKKGLRRSYLLSIFIGWSCHIESMGDGSVNVFRFGALFTKPSRVHPLGAKGVDYHNSFTTNIFSANLKICCI